MHFVMTTSSSSACVVGCSLWLIYALPFRRLPARKPLSIFKLWAATAGTTQSQTLPDWEWTSSLPRRLGAQLNGQVSWELTGVGNGAGFYSRLVTFLGDLNQSHFYTLCACFPIWKKQDINQDVLCKSPWNLLMERLGKSEALLLSHSSSPLVSPFIIFLFFLLFAF